MKHTIEVKTEECLLWAPSRISLSPADHQIREPLFMSAGIDEAAEHYITFPRYITDK